MSSHLSAISHSALLYHQRDAALSQVDTLSLAASRFRRLSFRLAAHVVARDVQITGLEVKLARARKVEGTAEKQSSLTKGMMVELGRTMDGFIKKGDVVSRALLDSGDGDSNSTGNYLRDRHEVAEYVLTPPDSDDASVRDSISVSRQGPEEIFESLRVLVASLLRDRELKLHQKVQEWQQTTAALEECSINTEGNLSGTEAEKFVLSKESRSSKDRVAELEKQIRYLDRRASNLEKGINGYKRGLKNVTIIQKKIKQLLNDVTATSQNALYRKIMAEKEDKAKTPDYEDIAQKFQTRIQRQNASIRMSPASEGSLTDNDNLEKTKGSLIDVDEVNNQPLFALMEANNCLQQALTSAQDEVDALRKQLYDTQEVSMDKVVAFTIASPRPEHQVYKEDMSRKIARYEREMKRVKDVIRQKDDMIEDLYARAKQLMAEIEGHRKTVRKLQRGGERETQTVSFLTSDIENLPAIEQKQGKKLYETAEQATQTSPSRNDFSQVSDPKDGVAFVVEAQQLDHASGFGSKSASTEYRDEELRTLRNTNELQVQQISALENKFKEKEAALTQFHKHFRALQGRVTRQDKRIKDFEDQLMDGNVQISPPQETNTALIATTHTLPS
jgi:chromosome segregation ATPase